MYFFSWFDPEINVKQYLFRAPSPGGGGARVTRQGSYIVVHVNDNLYRNLKPLNRLGHDGGNLGRTGW